MQSIKAKAFFLLAKRAYFSKQLAKKLQEKGYPNTEIEELLLYFKERGWINDHELAHSYINKLRQRGYGPQVIKWKLREKMGTAFEETIEEREEDLHLFIQKRYKNKLVDQRQKVISSLLSRGFSYELIRRVIDQM